MRNNLKIIYELYKKLNGEYKVKFLFLGNSKIMKCKICGSENASPAMGSMLCGWCQNRVV